MRTKRQEGDPKVGVERAVGGDKQDSERSPDEAHELAQQLATYMLAQLVLQLPEELRESITLLPPATDLTEDALRAMSAGKLPQDWYADAAKRWGPPSLSMAGSEAPGLPPRGSEVPAEVNDRYFDRQVEWMTTGALEMCRRINGGAAGNGNGRPARAETPVSDAGGEPADG